MKELTLADLEARAFIYHAAMEPDYAEGRVYLTVNRHRFWAPLPAVEHKAAS